MNTPSPLVPQGAQANARRSPIAWVFAAIVIHVGVVALCLGEPREGMSVQIACDDVVALVESPDVAFRKIGGRRTIGRPEMR